MIAQLQGREKGARALRVEGRRAEWIAFACLHSSVFIRDQRSRFLVLCSQSLFRFADLGMMDCAEAVQTKGVGLSFLRSM